MKRLIFLVLSRYRLAFKYRIDSRISIYNWMQNCIFSYVWYCIFIFIKSYYKSQAISNCCDKSDGLSHDELRAVSFSSDSNLTQNIIRETIKLEERRDESR